MKSHILAEMLLLPVAALMAVAVAGAGAGGGTGAGAGAAQDRDRDRDRVAVRVDCVTAKGQTETSGIQVRPLPGAEARAAGYNMSLAVAGPASRYRVSVSSLTRAMLASGGGACVKSPLTLSGSRLVALFDVDNPQPQCERIEMEFSALFLVDGCYVVNVTPLRNASSGRSEVFVTEITNGFVAENFAIERPEFKVDNDVDRAELRWGFRETVFVADGLKYVVEIATTASKVDATERCDRRDEVVVCECDGLPIGNYTVEFKLLDVWRCSVRHGIFGESCHWHQKFERIVPLRSRGLQATERFPLSTLLNTLLIFAAVAVVSVVLLLWMRRRIAIMKNKNCYPPRDVEFMIEKENIDSIFLVYARDHDLFMNAMAEFRVLLSKMTGCEVIDVFDYDCFDKLALAPQEFIQSLIKNTNTVCIIVENECADIILQTITHNSNSGEEVKLADVYREPHCMDHLILYSLKLITYDLLSPSYQKYHVVRLSRFNGCRYLKDLNPFTRYEIPTSLDILMDNIVGQTNFNHHLVKRKANNISQILIEKIKDFQEFVEENPKYLKTSILKADVADKLPI